MSDDIARAMEIICVRKGPQRKTGSRKDWIKKEVPCWAMLGGIKHEAIIKEFEFASQGDYYWCKIEIIKDNPLWTGQVLRAIYPKPIQSYYLTRRKVEQQKEGHSEEEKA